VSEPVEIEGVRVTLMGSGEIHMRRLGNRYDYASGYPEELQLDFKGCINGYPSEQEHRWHIFWMQWWEQHQNQIMGK
jgi:hypothetical protein